MRPLQPVTRQDLLIGLMAFLCWIVLGALCLVLLPNLPQVVAGNHEAVLANLVLILVALAGDGILILLGRVFVKRLH